MVVNIQLCIIILTVGPHSSCPLRWYGHEHVGSKIAGHTSPTISSGTPLKLLVRHRAHMGDHRVYHMHVGYNGP
ncbi:hypothetical protein B0H12DRAFT_1151382 [Mycena haematopus]|nr:hypothetical protein B0H12DRAFT_1151382 [Mycena haematopus]